MLQETFIGLSAGWWNVLGTWAGAIFVGYSVYLLVGDQKNQKMELIQQINDANISRRDAELARMPELMESNKNETNNNTQVVVKLRNRGQTMRKLVAVADAQSTADVILNSDVSTVLDHNDFLVFTFVSKDRKSGITQVVRSAIFTFTDTHGVKYKQHYKHNFDEASELTHPEKY